MITFKPSFIPTELASKEDPIHLVKTIVIQAMGFAPAALYGLSNPNFNADTLSLLAGFGVTIAAGISLWIRRS